MTANLRALIEQKAIEYHKRTDGQGEGEYGCNGPTCPGVQRLIAFAEGCVEAALAVEGEPARSHEACHDLVCNGDRRFPRGVIGHGCSCRGRDLRAVEGEPARGEDWRAWLTAELRAHFMTAPKNGERFALGQRDKDGRIQSAYTTGVRDTCHLLSKALEASPALLQGAQDVETPDLQDRYNELLELVRAVLQSTREDEKGEQWTIRQFLNTRKQFNDDIASSRRLVALACQNVLAWLESSQPALLQGAREAKEPSTTEQILTTYFPKAIARLTDQEEGQ